MCFPFTTKTLNDLLSFSIYLLDDNNNRITFPDGAKKISILKFKIDVFLRWIGNWDRLDQLKKLRKNKLISCSKTLKKKLRRFCKTKYWTKKIHWKYKTKVPTVPKTTATGIFWQKKGNTLDKNNPKNIKK